MQSIIQKLDELACLREKVAAVQAELDQRFREVGGDTLMARDELSSRAALIEAGVKSETLALGKSVSGAALQSVFSRGRVSWDSKVLDGLAIVYPDLIKAKKEGEPFVSIRPVNGKGGHS